ncbi:MAG: hypothetical protein RL769_511, partial [Pseudomonadota bacterium]
HTIEKRQGLKIACLEEVAYNNKLIGKKEIEDIVKDYNNDYNHQEYLKKIINYDN